MAQCERIYLCCSEPTQLVTALNRILADLQPDDRRRLIEVFKNYVTGYGIERTYELMNNRSVEQICAEYQPPNSKPIVMGEVDGARYALYRPALPDSGGPEDQKSE